MSVSTKSLIGRGPSFPLNRSNIGGLLYTEDIERINHSIFLILETPKGSRLMMPEFGSDIHKYKFDPLDQVLMEKIKHTLRQDITKWEPRVLITDIVFLTDEQSVDNNILYISMTYRIVNTTITANYVYPYQLGTYDTLKISYK